MRSSHDCKVDVVRLRKRYRRNVAAVVCGALLLILAGTVAALVAANRRAVQAFDFRPGLANDHRPRASSPSVSTTAVAAPAPTQPPDSTAAPEVMWDTQESFGGAAHHRKNHGRRFARWHSHRHGGMFGFFAGR